MNHTYDMEIIGKDTNWTCPDCGRKVIERLDGVEIVNKGNQSVQHTTVVCPDGFSLNVGGNLSEPVPNVFAKYLGGVE